MKNFIVNSKAAALTFHVNVLESRHGYLPANGDILRSLSVEEIFYLRDLKQDYSNI